MGEEQRKKIVKRNVQWFIYFSGYGYTVDRSSKLTLHREVRKV